MVSKSNLFSRSLQTGRLLEVISAHEGPVSSLSFCPSAASSQLATVSWDKTLRLWDALSVGTSSESIPLVSDATAVTFRPGKGIFINYITERRWRVSPWCYNTS